jgi:hypothetical protein
MGWSLSWAALKGGDADSVCSLLGLRKTGKREDIAKCKVSGTELPSGWYVVVFKRTEIKDRTLEKLSQAGEAVGCFVEEHIMFSSAAYWKNGEQIWRVFHDGGEDRVEHLETSGRLPTEFEAIRAEAFAKQEREKEDDEIKVDHVFEIPVRMAKALTGFQHDDPESGLAENSFEVLEPEGSGGMLGKLFGFGKK